MMTGEPASIAEAALREGLALHRQGRLEEARSRYEVALRAQPRQFAALHLSGLLAYQSNDPRRALELFNEAILLDPRSAAAHHDRGNALLELQRHESAIESYEEAIALAPDYADAHYNRGNALLDLGRNSLAVASFERAIACRADHAPSHINRGLALLGLGQHQAALQSFEQALALSPHNADAYHFRANALRLLKQHDAALASYDRAIELAPTDAQIHNSRASALAERRCYVEALSGYERAIALRPDFAAAHCNRANVLAALREWDAALEGYGRAVALRPDFTEAYFNSGNVHKERGHWEAALADYERAIAAGPNHAEAHCNRGLVLQRLNHIEAALASYERAIALKPDFARAHVNRSLALLVKGDFEQGWSDYEWRWKLDDSSFIHQRRALSQPRWRGGDTLSGKTILMHSEQGFGDTLQFCRYAKLVADLGARVILEVQPPLKSLLVSLQGAAEVLATGDAHPPFDCYCPLMSLPLALRTTLSSVPADVPYIKSSAAKRRHWEQLLGKRLRPRVGLVWSGGVRPGHLEPWWVDERRNIPLASFEALQSLDIEIYSLQKGQSAEAELNECIARGWSGPTIRNFSYLLHDFSDTAALLEQLDLIISVDTAVAHLAGALGKPVWILNRFDTCWRWLLDRADSPWYPTARIYRQQVPGDWDSVVRRVVRDLHRVIAGGSGRVD